MWRRAHQSMKDDIDGAGEANSSLNYPRIGCFALGPTGAISVGIFLAVYVAPGSWGARICMAENVTQSVSSAATGIESPERQVTSSTYGHILTNFAVWSPDSRWLVYDVRSDPAGAVFDGTRIERVNVRSGEVETLYESPDGACCGVATYSPVADDVVFIHGPEHPSPNWQYRFDHRRGVVVHCDRPLVATNLDARDLVTPYTPGALRGGTHVHVFSGDGRCVSFTYEDQVLTERDQQNESRGIAVAGDHNQRNVGISLLGNPVRVPHTHERNHDGEAFSVLVTRTVNNPTPGSDEISKAYDDAWVGRDGYLRADGTQQPRAIAFLGDVLSHERKPIAELFVVDIPEDITVAGELPLEGTSTRRPGPPLGTRQRRLTYTSGRRYPGLSGPRQWPRSSPDGSRIAFLMRDDSGIVQLWVISPNGGPPAQVTHHSFDVASAFSWHPNGRSLAYIADESPWLTDVATGQGVRQVPKDFAVGAPRPEACVVSPDGQAIAYVRPVVKNGATHNQIFTAKVSLPDVEASQ